MTRGANVGAPPDPSKWILTREKTAGVHPGFTARDGKGETWFLQFDPPYYDEGATGAVAVASRMFWALGYNQVELFITSVDPKKVEFYSNELRVTKDTPPTFLFPTAEDKAGVRKNSELVYEAR
jgi:hypothetical protein